MGEMLPKLTIDKIKKISKSVNVSIQNFEQTNDPNDIPLEILKIYYQKKINNQKSAKNNRLNWRKEISSIEQIITDINEYSKKIETLPSCYLAPNFIPRSTIGHAHAGHCSYQDNPKVNTTLKDIISDSVLQKFTKGKSPWYINRFDFLSETQRAIDSVGNLVYDAIENPNRILDVTQGGIDSPIFGIPFWDKFDSQALLKGIFFGGNFDNYKVVRRLAEKYYTPKLGGGESFLINYELIQKLGINITELTSANYQDQILLNLNSDIRIELFKKIGLIYDAREIDFSNVKNWDDIKAQCLDLTESRYDSFFQEYIRFEKGNGVSDDIACMIAAFIGFDPNNKKRDGYFYKSLSNGANIADFVDTMTKATILYTPGGLDEAIAKFANYLWLKKVRTDKRYRENHGINLNDLERRLEHDETEDFALVPLREIIDLTATAQNPYFGEIHSSARYFIKMLEGTYALEQEAMINQRRLKSFGANTKVKLDCGETEIFDENINALIPIGFNKIKLNNIIHYLDKEIYPIVSQTERREELIKQKYN